MDKNVRVIIKGLHNMVDEESDVTVETEGTYYNKNGMYYICYEEKDEYSDEMHTNVLKIKKEYIELIKRGKSPTRLKFETGKLNNTYYNTAVGSLYVGTDTKSIYVSEDDKSINVKIEYELVIDEEKVADCVVEIQIIKK